MKVLVTGCSSAQTSESVAKKLPTFTGLLVQALKESGHEVIWDTPTMRWDEQHLAQYDSVVVGLTAPTSIASYRLYGALSVIEKASKVTNVKYLIDAPEPHKLWNGVRAIYQNPENLVKDFYSRRSEYNLAKVPEETTRLHGVIDSLYNNRWSTTIVPSLPWFSVEHVSNHISGLDSETVEPLCLDSILMKNLENTGLYMKSNPTNWSYDIKTPWVSKVSKTLSSEVEQISPSGGSHLSTLNRSIGSLISVHKNNEPWWSPVLAESLCVNTPVATEWRHSSSIGASWSVLPHAIEDMSNQERASLAMEQKKEYVKSIDSYKDALSRVSSVVFNN